MPANLVPEPEPPDRRRRPAGRVRAYVGLGANLGEAATTLAHAVAALNVLPGARVTEVSALYATRPVGVEDQPEFRNAVVAIDVPGGADPAAAAIALLVALKRLERAFGRRPHERWAARELDLDLLLFGPHRLVVERPPDGLSVDAAADLGRRPDRRILVVPHPEAADRLFVLAPLADLAPALTPPGWSETVGQARDRRERAEGADAVRRVATWDPVSSSWQP
ncbi:MAG TPA: 2-amino-4-hydroxy-6-hydroxymethyldihydropteridine diphosphokinase [Candidatus Limnocylindrales bacterium]|nr:2-amino-4-hydroxy-6-hydroxymethyldihydropteridine diphosphokinase [Candidatus Limnocylindrales bacterium]